MVHTYIHVYMIHIKVSVFSVYLSVCVYVYMCIFMYVVCVCVCMYVCVYTIGSPFTRVLFARATKLKMLYLVVDVLGPVATL